jgi:hypothetical protein
MVPAPEFVARAIGGLLAFLCACAPSGELAPSTRLVAAAVQAGGPNPDASLLSLTVTGACSVRYEVTTVTTDGAAWLRLPQGGTGTIAPGQTRTVLVGFDVVSTNLRAGTYVGSLIVTGRCDDLEGRMARGSPLVVPASLNVTPGPVVPPVCGERMPGVEAEPMNEGPRRCWTRTFNKRRARSTNTRMGPTWTSIASRSRPRRRSTASRPSRIPTNRSRHRHAQPST